MRCAAVIIAALLAGNSISSASAQMPGKAPSAQPRKALFQDWANAQIWFADQVMEDWMSGEREIRSMRIFELKGAEYPVYVAIYGNDPNSLPIEITYSDGEHSRGVFDAKRFCLKNAASQVLQTC